MGHKQVDHIYTRFGRLVVIAKAESKRSRCGTMKRFWVCKCDCGNETIASTGSLISGNVRSCGCLQNESSANNGKKSRHKVAKENNLYKRVLYNYKKSAAKRGIEWGLTDEEAISLIEQNCAYCGVNCANRIKSGTVVKKEFFYNGIDRIDNTKGYIPENVNACCDMCNHAKKNHSLHDFLQWSMRLAMNTLEVIKKDMKNELARNA